MAFMTTMDWSVVITDATHCAVYALDLDLCCGREDDLEEGRLKMILLS